MRPRVPSPRPSRRARNKKAVDFIIVLPRGSALSKAFAQQTKKNEDMCLVFFTLSGSALSKAFAQQTKKNEDMCLVFFTLRGRKFPHGNFRTTRVLRSQNTTCLRNKVSQTSQIPSCDALAGGDFSFIWCFYFMMSLSCAAFATRPDSARSAMRFGNTIRPLNRSDRFQTRSTCSAEPITMQATTIAA
jgi:hypothetical protein